MNKLSISWLDSKILLNAQKLCCVLMSSTSRISGVGGYNSMRLLTGLQGEGCQISQFCVWERGRETL